MVYAYDQWAQMPVKDLYDSQMMAFIINAAKDQYDQTKADMKEFNKEYGDFVSPFQKDMDLYGSTIGRIKDIVNNADIHTQAGRAAIQKAINSVDPRLYNQMRANAKMGYAYQDTLQKLAAQGKFDKDMNDWWLRNKLGVGSFEDFSTAGNNGALNSWNVSSPIQAATLQQLTDDLYKGLDARDLSAAEAKAALGDAYDPRAKYTGNTFGDLLKVAREGVPGLTGDPRLDYFREMSRQTALARNPNASATEIENQFQRDVANANIRYLRGPKGDISDWLQMQNLSLKKQQLAQAAELARIKQNGGGKGVKRNGNGYAIDENDTRMPWNQKFMLSHQLNRAESLVGNPGTDNLTTLEKTLTRIYNAYNQMLVQESKNAGGKVTEGRVVKEATPAEYAFNIGSVYGGPAQARIKSATKEQRERVYSAVQTKAYRDIKKQRDQLKFVLDDISRLRDIAANNKTDDASMRLAQLAQQRIGKYIDQYGMPTPFLESELAKADAVALTKVKNDEDLINYANNWYKTRQNRSNYGQSTVSYGHLLGMIGAGDRQTIPQLGVDKRTIDLNKVLYSPLHRVNVSGGGSMVDKNSIMNYFQKWMSNSTETAVLYNENLNSALVESKNTVRPQMEAFGYGAISPRQFNIFYSTLPANIQRKYNKKEVAATLGLVPIDINSKEDENGNLGKEFTKQTYYNIPITGIQDTGEILQGIEQNDNDSKTYYGVDNTKNTELEDAVFDLVNLNMY